MSIIKFRDQEIVVSPRDEVDVSVMREIFKLREYKAAETIIAEAEAPILDVGSHAGFFIGKESRLGFTIEELFQIPDKSIIKGLHLYVGTDIFDIDYFINCYKELIEIAAEFPKAEEELNNALNQ